MTADSDDAAILSSLYAVENPANREGMARHGIATEHAVGVSMPFLREMAEKIGKDHTLAGQLWNS